jgi:hypothetical protein
MTRNAVPSSMPRNVPWPSRLVLWSVALVASTGCERSLGPPDSFVSAAVDSVWARSNEGSEEQLRLYIDGHFEPRVCARLRDVGAMTSGDSLFFQLRAERARDCSDSLTGFRHTLLIDNRLERTLVVWVRALGQAETKTLELRLPLAP